MKLISKSIIALSFLFISCKDEGISEGNTQETNSFKLRYQLNIIEFDSIAYYRMRTRTYYLDKRRSIDNGGKEGFLGNDSINFKNGISFFANMPVYEGCSSEVEIKVYRNKNGHFISRNYLIVDTIKSKSDSLLNYNWPDDTVKAKLIWE